MKKMILVAIVLSSKILLAQPGKNKLPFCDSLQLVLQNCKDGFINYRYNETPASVSVTYSTTLPGLGFTKKFVQTGTVNPYKSERSAILPGYIATAVYADPAKATEFFNSIHNNIKLCIRPFATDTITKPGFVRSFYYQVAKPVKDSFITVELMMLGDSKSSTVALRIFHNKGNVARGNMKNPPVTIVADKNRYQEVLPLIKALMEYSANNFTAIRGQLLQGEKWKPTYSSTLRFSDFNFPKIEYVTNNLWNQYTTSLRFNVFSTANKRFNEIAAAIDSCESTFTDQRFETRSTPGERWWYYDNVKKDVEGKSYKNALRLEVIKFPYGDGYYVTFEFRKSVAY